MDHDYTGDQGLRMTFSQGQGNEMDKLCENLRSECRGQGIRADNGRGKDQSSCGSQGRYQEIPIGRGQDRGMDDGRGQDHGMDDGRGQDHGMDDGRGQDHGMGDGRGQDHGIDDGRGQGQSSGGGRGKDQENPKGRGQDQGILDDGRGQGHRKRRSRADTSGSDEGSHRRRRRKGSSVRRTRCRSRRYRSTSSESSGESNSIIAHSRSKRTRDLDANVILDKVLSIIKDVRGSDKAKLSYNNVIPDFDPMTKEQTMLTWINKVEECAEIYKWDEKETIHYALPKLCGIAKSWYQGLPTVMYSWSEWKKKLLESFPSREDYAELLTEMLNKRARFGDSLEQYYYAKINILNRCKITGRRAVDCLLHGIDDRAVRVGAQAAQFSEPESVLKYFRTIKSGTIRESSDTMKKNKIERYNSTNRQTMTSRFTGSNNSIRCFNCNQIGHPSFKCDKPLIKCTICDRVGHQASNCYKNKDNNSKNRFSEDKKEKQVSEVSVDDKTNNKYIMDVRVNEILFQCHLDLGSQCSLMRESDAKLLNVNFKADEDLPILRGIGANLIKPLGMIVATVDIQNIKEVVSIYVVEDYVLKYPILVGHSFTEKPDITITKTPDSVIVSRIQNTEKVHLISTSKVQIPVDGLRAIPVTCTNLRSGRIYVNGTVRGKDDEQFYLLPGEYSIKNNCCALLIQNVSNASITIENNFLVTRATHINKTLDVNEISISASEIDDTIVCNTNLTTEQRLALQALLAEYKECFSSGLKDLGYTNATEMTIELEDSEPVVYRPYRMSYPERCQVRDMIKEMIESGIVRESSSPYASPIVLVKKKTGDKRLCVDYRALNRKTKKYHYPLPRIEDQLDLLAGNNMFISLDLASGYYQIPISEDSRDKTAFVTPDGQFEYNRMPFGLVNAPSIFQRTMNKILADARVKYALVYMDDILIPCKNFEEGMDRLREVLSLLKEGGLTLKMSKCNFFLDKIDFLGFEVSSNGIRPGSKKCEAVSNFPIPCNQHELRQFLGLSGFFRRFIKDYAIVASPLTELLKKDRVWTWAESQEKSFNRIKLLLSERPLLALYDPKAETQLHTDASKNGLAGILLQRNTNGALQPVAYFSRKTTAEEQKYHSFDLETLAVVASLNRFRVYLIGISFIIQTDCNAVRSTLNKRDLVPRIARWWLQLQEYDCTIEYRPGAKMAHVDALSRNPIDIQTDGLHVLDVLLVDSEQDWITTVQSADDEIARIKNILNDPNTENVLDIHKNFKLKNGRVYRIVGDELKWFVPSGARWQIVKRNHDDVGHYGYEKTLERIKKHYWFGRMRRFVKKYVSACLECAHHKAPGGKPEGELHPIEKNSIPFHTIHADHLGPFVKSRTGNCYLLVIIDGFTKYINITPVKNTKSITTIKVMKDHISFFGVPTRLITDRGSSFTSKSFKSFTVEYGIKHVLNAVATPRANGQVERFNRTITEALATSNHGKDEKLWDEHVRDIQIGLNTTINKTTQKSPSELLFGFVINHKTQGILGPVINDTVNVIPPDELECTRKKASKRIQEQQQKDALRFNKHRKLSKKYRVGDLVRIQRQVPHDGQSQKLVVKYQGPYRIVKALEHDRYIVEDTPLSRKNGRRYEGTVAVDKIQPWMSFDRNFDSDSNGDNKNSNDDSDDEALVNNNECVNDKNLDNSRKDNE